MGVAALLTMTLLAACMTSAQEANEPNGAELYARHCAACHGTVGEGDGPVAEVMQVTVPNLRTLTARSGGEFPRDAVMRYIDGRNLPAAHGARLMPVWGDTFAGDGEDGEALARRRIAAITAFVERLQN
jgi:mono/diheme cytochrome c family protein